MDHSFTHQSTALSSNDFKDIDEEITFFMIQKKAHLTINVKLFMEDSKIQTIISKITNSNENDKKT